MDMLIVKRKGGKTINNDNIYHCNNPKRFIIYMCVYVYIIS